MEAPKIKAPKIGETWDIGSYVGVKFVGVGRTFEEVKYFVFEKPEGGFFLMLKDEFYSTDGRSHLRYPVKVE